MTPLNFRAWHKEGQFMTDLLGFGVSKIGDDYTKYIEWEDHRGERMRTGNFDEYIIMQSTGLKDKNGKEIFEGDMVFCPELTYLINAGLQKPGYDRNVVTWSDENTGFHPFTECFIGCYDGMTITANKCEVIGDIYSNPDLLPSS